MHLGEQMASVACNLLAALHRDPAWRSLCSVVRLAEHACPARGASWLAARRPRGGGKARLVLQPVVHPFGTPVSFEICGELPARHVASGLRRTDGIILQAIKMRLSFQERV